MVDFDYAGPDAYSLIYTKQALMIEFDNSEEEKELFTDSDFDLMQYTGFKFKGQEVYESDLVKTKYQKLAKIVWINEYACFALETVDDTVKGELMFCLSDIEEILGNIYETPHLLAPEIRSKDVEGTNGQ